MIGVCSGERRSSSKPTAIPSTSLSSVVVRSADVPAKRSRSWSLDQLVVGHAALMHARALLVEARPGRARLLGLALRRCGRAARPGWPGVRADRPRARCSPGDALAPVLGARAHAARTRYRARMRGTTKGEKSHDDESNHDDGDDGAGRARGTSFQTGSPGRVPGDARPRNRPDVDLQAHSTYSDGALGAGRRGAKGRCRRRDRCSR